ncbi:MAG: hypothetical protein NAG76_19570 [Candidatus Pristimantibacillus lignocellulolyticus]|uniref:Uncharacterized protein n=1 Tax=Candidatus Pristimantibacillus lignocellulolyticus TaxID=2994561 RepID=A0A9J6ZD28_9BACL|nr:MAG: hypothetical protein NAG76_19570 [Candidatus Pristimantibacillus lignocellulolyticus]
MKRWKKVVLWIASILVVVAIGGAFAANYAIDKMLGSMSGLSTEILENTGEEGNSNSGDPDVSPDDNGSNDVVAGDTPVSNDSSSSNEGKPQGEGSTGTIVTDPNSSENQSSEGSSGTGGYDSTVSTDKAKEVEEKVTLGEKAKVVSILTKRLSASDISTMQSLASGGLSGEEKKQARTLMLEKLTEDEYNELVAIAAKYGLSQGRSYAEVSNE